MNRPNPTAMLQQQLLTQQSAAQRQSAAEAAAYEEQRAYNQATLKSSIDATMAGNLKQQQKKASQPVSFGTLLTSPRGLLGNPVLSSTKLGG